LTVLAHFPSLIVSTDSTEQTKINFQHEISPTAQKYLLEATIQKFVYFRFPKVYELYSIA